MINEVMAKHIKKGVIADIAAGWEAREIVNLEIAKRGYIIKGLDTQRKKEVDEIAFLKSLDPNELGKEAGGK